VGIRIVQKMCALRRIRESRVHTCQDVNDAREPVYWLLYHQNRSMLSCKSGSHKCAYVNICMWLYSHVRTHYPIPGC